MIRLDEAARKFWSASFYLRRGHDRDKAIAIAILKQITETQTGKLNSRATETLKEYDDEQ